MVLYKGNCYFGSGVFNATMNGDVLTVTNDDGITQSMKCDFFMIGEDIPMLVECKSDGIYLVEYLVK